MATPARALRYRSGGNLREGDFYVERATDDELYAALLAGEYCHLLAPRQIGKSSLRVRTERRLREQGVRCASIDLTAISDGAGGGGTPEQWYATLCEKLCERLKLDEEAARAAWQRLPGTLSHRWIRFLRDQVLAAEAAPVVVFLDEIDYIQRAPFCADFFASIRAMYNLRAEDPAYQRLTFCLVGVAAPADLIEDAALTPFNIGQAIRLADFSAREARALLPGLAEVPGDAQKLLTAVLAWTSGHPYMTQRLCEALSSRRGRSAEADEATPSLSEEARVARAVDELFLRRREEDLNLTAAEKRLEQSPKRSLLLRLYRRLLDAAEVTAHKDDPIQLELRLTGMAAERRTESGEHRLQVRNRVFATVFDREWLDRKEPNPLLAQVLPLWLKSGKSEEYLLRGPLLKEAQAWSQGRPDLSADEREFLIAALQAAQREEQNAALEKLREKRAAEIDAARRKRIRSQFAFILLLLVILGATIVEAVRARRATATARREQERAEEERGRARVAKERAEAAEQRTREQLTRTRVAEQLARAEKQAADQARNSTDAALRRAVQQQQIAEQALRNEQQAKERAVAAESQARKAQEQAQQRQREAEAAQGAAEQSAQAERAARALVLTGQPGKELEALLAAMQAAGPTLAGQPHLSLQELADDDHGEGRRKTAEALVAAVSAMSHAVPPSLVLRANHARVRAVRFSPDGAQAFTTYQDGQTVRWDAQTGQQLAGLGPDALPATAAAPTDPRVQVITGVAHVYDARHHEVNALGDNVERAALSPSGRLIATTSALTPTVLISDAQSGEPRRSLDGHQSKVMSLAFAADEQHLLTASRDGTARIWRLDGSAPALILRGHGSAVQQAVYAPDGRRVLTGSDDGTARIWQLDGGRSADGPLLLGALTLGHQSAVNGAAFSPDGGRLLTIGWDHRGTLWDRRGARLAELAGHTDIINSARFSRDGRYVVTASQDGTARLWELPTGKAYRDLAAPAPREPVRSAELSADGRYVATASRDGVVRLFEAASGRALAQLATAATPTPRCPEGGAAADHAARRAAATAATFSPDGRFLLGGFADCAAQLWELPAGKASAVPLQLSGGVTSAAFSPDSRWAAVASESGAVVLVPVGPGAPRDRAGAAQPGPRHLAAVNLVLFSHDGALLLSASSDGTAKLWDVAAQRERTPALNEHTGEIYAAAFSPDDRLVATASQDGTARIFSARTGASLATLRGARGAVYAVDFAPDGGTLVTASIDQTARLYPTDVGDYFRLGCRLLHHQPEYPQIKRYCEPGQALP